MNQKKIFTNGCFDVIHRGHIELLKYCASLGEVTVGLNSDASVSRLKGAGRPVTISEDRKTILESIKYVKEVIIFEEDTPIELINMLKPDIIVKGGDYERSNVVGADVAEVVIFNTIPDRSSTRIISMIEKKA